MSFFTIERLHQEVFEMEIVTDVVYADVSSSKDLELQTGDTQLTLQPTGLDACAVSWALPVVSADATARFSRQKRALTVRSPLDGAHRHHESAETRVHVTVSGLGRGEVLVRLQVPASEADLLHYVLVAREGQFATLDGKSAYTWCHCFRSPAAGSILTVRIDAAAWVWDSADALLTFGALAGSGAAPSIDPELEQVGVSFAVQPVEPSDGSRSATSSGNGSLPWLCTDFVPEEAALPSDELRRACRLYGRAFAAIDGAQLSREYTRRRPQPPKWVGGAQDDAEVVDLNYSSLTYGEAEFVPLYAMLAAVGVPSGGVLVDLGSGTGRMVLCAALAFPSLRQARGIEIVPDLHSGAVAAHRRLRSALDAANPNPNPNPNGRLRSALDAAHTEPTPCAPVVLTEGDVLTVPWVDADLVLITSLCFPPALVALVRHKARLLKAGSRILCMQADFDEEDDSDEDEPGDAAEGAAEGAAPPAVCRRPEVGHGGCKEHGDPTPFLRRVEVRPGEAPPWRHQIKLTMSFGETCFYVYERC